MTDEFEGACDDWDDPAFEAITSPLSSNVALRELLETIDLHRCENDSLQESGCSEAHDRHMDGVAALADYLSIASEIGRFQKWDFEACYLNDERVKNLYDSNRQLSHLEFIEQDFEQMLEDIHLAETVPDAVEREVLRNLQAVLRRLEGGEAVKACDRVERLLAN